MTDLLQPDGSDPPLGCPDETGTAVPTEPTSPRERAVQHLMHEALERIEVAVAQAQDLRDDLCAVRDDLRAAIERLAAERGAQ